MMSRLAKPWLMAAAVALVAMGASSSRAGEAAGAPSLNKMDQQAMERSWAIQAELARIEKNREAFVDELLASWAPVLDGKAYDLQAELRPIAMKALPWRLYGASLVGDFRTMVKILRGEIGAGRYINALSAPQPRMAPRPLVLGDTTADLVFTPIAPCRMVDTRGVGARQGILTPGVPRTFDLTTGGFVKGQGSDASCVGLPGFSHDAWAINITLAQFTVNGNLKIYPFSGAVPTSSIINYVPGSGAIANAATAAGCYACADDVTVVANAGNTQVIIDVLGYYEQAAGFAVGTPVVTFLNGTLTTIAGGGFSFIIGGACPAGTSLIGGGQTNSALGTMLTSDQSRSGAAWYEYVKNTGGTSETVTVFSTCLDVN